MKFDEFPALYRAADREAARTQKLYFWMLRTQYFCLFFASLITLFAGHLDRNFLLTVYLSLLATGSIAALTLATAKPNERWYRFRALAESCKTLSWRYAMGAEPFSDASRAAETDALFAARLHELVTFQPVAFARLIPSEDTDEQATQSMKEIQQGDFQARKNIYLKHRIDDQLDWYRAKARANRSAAQKSLVFIVLLYLAAVATTVLQFYFPLVDGQVLWVAEPLLVLVASVLGYAQAKRFSELSASYALTALEIQKLRAGFVPLSDDAALRIYINTAEDAFSREHTQWLARLV